MRRRVYDRRVAIIAVLVVAILGAHAVAQAWVTVRLWKNDELTDGQKWAQTALVWLVPLFGMAIVYSLLGRDPPPPAGELDFDEDMGGDSPELDVPDHAHAGPGIHSPAGGDD
jgi:hypothetical protein